MLLSCAVAARQRCACSLQVGELRRGAGRHEGGPGQGGRRQSGQPALQRHRLPRGIHSRAVCRLHVPVRCLISTGGHDTTSCSCMALHLPGSSMGGMARPALAKLSGLERGAEHFTIPYPAQEHPGAAAVPRVADARGGYQAEGEPGGGTGHHCITSCCMCHTRHYACRARRRSTRHAPVTVPSCGSVALSKLW